MKKTTRKQLRTIRRRRLALALVGAMAMPMMPVLAQSLPSSGDVVNGTASIGSAGNQMTVTQTTKGAIIDWGSFNIGAGYGVTFDQQFGASSVTLNRVVGFGYSSSASQIDGTLTSNGNVFIINPAGITFGSNAQVNVGGIVASTLWMNSGDFINGLATGQYVFAGFNGDASATHQVRNNGTITAGAGGVGLVGQTVWNSGSITSNGGNIVAGAGTQVTLDLVGDGLTQVTINVPPTVDSGVIQDRTGSMTADGGQILLRSAATAGGTGGAIYVSGTLQAQSIANVNGRVELTSNGGPVMLGAPGIFSDAGSPYTTGSIDVSGGIGETGGSVLISGNGVILVNDDANPLGPTDPYSTGSTINATGREGGGSITISSTGSVLAMELTRLDASGVVDGSGGTVDLLANGGSAVLYGDIGALSGKVSGNGGRIRIGALDGIVQDQGSISASAVGNGGQVGLVTSNGDIVLTDVEAYGRVDGGSIVASSAGGIYVYGDVNVHGLYGDGGTISFLAQGEFYGAGAFDAGGGANGGSIYVGGSTTDPTEAAVRISGTIDASGGSGDGGIVDLEGNGGIRFEGDIYAQGGTNGGQVYLHETGPNNYGISLEATVDASGTNGSGGLIDIHATGDVYANELLAWGGIDGGDISVIGAAVDFYSAIAYGDAGIGGSVAITADNIFLTSYGYSIDVQGETGGGSIDLYARETLVLGEDSSLSADTGSSGIGGSIRLYAGDALVVYGDLSARGVDGGGSIYTGTGGYLDLNGIGIDAGTQAGDAGIWTISAPSLVVVNGDEQGSLPAGSYYVPPLTTRNIQDGDINNAFATGTNVVLQSADYVQFDDAQIVADNASSLSLIVNAEGGIFGNAFSIGSIGGTLDMVFNANASSLNNGNGGINFSNATLDSNGGNIAMYGQSDPVAGTASNYNTGIALADSTITTGGGNVLIRGSSTGADAGFDDAGVVLDGVDIDAGSGAIDIYGLGEGDTSGVIALNSQIVAGSVGIDGTAEDGGDGVNLYYVDIDAGLGDVILDGQSLDGDGLYAYSSNIVTAGGDISLTGIGGAQGVDFDGDSNQVYSYGGDILVRGEGGTGVGVYFSGQVNSDGGDITMYGLSAAAIGLDFGGGYYSGMVSDGGDIVLTGIGVTGGVQLQDSAFGAGNVIDSAGGAITVTGNASAPDGVGVYSNGVDLIGGAGDVTVTGVAPLGIGIVFDGGAGVSTTTGAIGLYGTGATFGLDIADGAIDTDSGDITLDGTATAADAVAGVRVTGDGLVTNGGNITVTGTSAGGVGVQLGDGGAFAIDSGGGDIDIYGYSATAEGLVFNGGFFDGISSAGGDIRLEGVGATAGTVLIGSGYGSNSIDSAGGLITIIGTASAPDAVGVLLSSLAVVGGSGDVLIDGVSPAGIGILFENGASVSTTTGAIGLYGTGADFGLDIADGAIDTDSGDITLDGSATAADAVAGVRVTGDGLTTNGGDITINGTSAGGVGVQLGDGGAFAIGSGGGAITIDGTGIDAGVLMQGNQVASGGGAVSITGDGEDFGVVLDGSDVDSGAGDITIRGDAVFGISAIGVSADDTNLLTTSGDILVTGIGNSVGLQLRGGEVATGSGHIDLRGRGTMGGAGTGLEIGQGVRIATDNGGIELSGTGNRAGGVVIRAGSSIDAGDSLLVLRADSGPGDAVDIQGSIHSSVGVNLRPGGVDANGGLTEATSDRIVLGSNVGQIGDSAFFLSNAELALIDTPELIIGSNLHAGAIQVLGGVSREGNLTLQNNGGTGGIDIQAALDVGDGTLALSSGGSITQTSAGVISAHSLLAQAGGDVLLATALNDVANTTLAGSAGGDFEFQDANTLAIGSVSAIGFDASAGQLSSFAATGISAGGDAFVRNLQGDLTLNAGVTATNIDLVTAGRLQNVAGASLVASGDWRVWANTWVGETRGGLAGDGNLPNLYGCAYLGACGVTVPGADNHFIYVQQPIALISFNNATREYGLPNPLLTFSVTGAILGDAAANVASGSATTTATIGSDVGNYAITGNFLSAAGYRIQFVPGTLAITPATLLFTADGAIRYLGFPNPDFTGTVTGFRNGDTVASVFGNTVIWSSPAGPLAPIGFYPVVGGTSARNYVFAQAEGNARALQIIPLPQLPSTPIEFIRETVNTYVYDRNFGGAPVCAVNASIDDTGLASTGDGLSTEWTKVRSRPNLTNCFDSERENGCGDF